MTVTIRGMIVPQHRERRGHNIGAVDFGYSPDRTLTAAPGGSYPAGNGAKPPAVPHMQCNKCHAKD